MPYKSRDGDFEPSNAHERILILFDVLRITKELVVLFPPPPPHQTFIPALIIDPPLPLSPSEGKKERKRERKRERNKKKTVAFRRLFPLPRFKEWRGGLDRSNENSSFPSRGIHPFPSGRKWISSKRSGTFSAGNLNLQGKQPP